MSRYDLISDVALDTWHAKANQNIDTWGDQSVDALLLATQEELGELTQAYLEHRSEDGDYQSMYGELDDLGALLIQLFNALERGDLE